MKGGSSFDNGPAMEDVILKKIILNTFFETYFQDFPAGGKLFLIFAASTNSLNILICAQKLTG